MTDTAYDPDAAPFAEAAAALAAAEGPFEFTIGEFMNPWHDEVGKFAPKGTGTKSDGVDDEDVTAVEVEPEDDYHGRHRPTETGPRVHDIIEGGIVPDDVYDHPEYYTGYSGRELRETMSQLRKVRGDPDAQVTIYRAAPDGVTINEGDWVTLSKTYAEGHAESQGNTDHPLVVHEMQVPAASVRWAVDDLMEFGYYPSTKEKLYNADDFTAMHRAQFANPWHDEIGRFAPKGYVRRGGHFKRTLKIPRNNEDGLAVLAAMELADAVELDPYNNELHQKAVQQLDKLSKDADPHLVETYLKPAAQALSTRDMETAAELIRGAENEMLVDFVESFSVPQPEKVTITQSEIDPDVYSTTTPEGRKIWFETGGYDVSAKQIEDVLSAATTAARAGKLKGGERTAADDQFDDQDIRIRVHVVVDENGYVDDRGVTLGWVDADRRNQVRHRTVNLSPELIEGNFDREGVTPQTDVMASGAVVSPLRWTTMHEIGHVTVFEQGRPRSLGGKGEDWVNNGLDKAIDSFGLRDMQFMTNYGRSNALEAHAEAFAEWVNTGGTTNNPVVRKFARTFGWTKPTPPKTTGGTP